MNNTRPKRANRYLFFLLYLLTLTATLQAQDSSSTGVTPLPEAAPPADTVAPVRYRLNGAYLKTYPYDFLQVASSPARWQGRDWVKFGTVAAVSGVLILAVDEPFREWAQNNRNDFTNKASELFYPLGNRFPPLLLTGMYLTGVLTKNRRLEHSSLAVAKSLAISTVFYTASKALIRRQRPTRTDDAHEFVGPIGNKGFTSFPSGHTNTAFAVATAFSLEYPDKKWIPWVAYPLATLTGLSRINDDRHWLSDVVIGAAIGHFVTKGVYKLEEKRKRSGKINLRETGF